MKDFKDFIYIMCIVIWCIWLFGCTSAPSIGKSDESVYSNNQDTIKIINLDVENKSMWGIYTYTTEGVKYYLVNTCGGLQMVCPQRDSLQIEFYKKYLSPLDNE